MSTSTAPVTESTIFSGRAEVTEDILRVVQQINKQTKPKGENGLTKVSINLGFFEPGFTSDEAMVEMHFDKPVSVEWVEEQVRQVPDSHVFLQTLLPIPLAQNICERNRDKR